MSALHGVLCLPTSMPSIGHLLNFQSIVECCAIYRPTHRALYTGDYSNFARRKGGPVFLNKAAAKSLASATQQANENQKIACSSRKIKTQTSSTTWGESVVPLAAKAATYPKQKGCQIRNSKKTAMSLFSSFQKTNPFVESGKNLFQEQISLQMIIRFYAASFSKNVAL